MTASIKQWLAILSWEEIPKGARFPTDGSDHPSLLTVVQVLPDRLLITDEDGAPGYILRSVLPTYNIKMDDGHTERRVYMAVDELWES